MNHAARTLPAPRLFVVAAALTVLLVAIALSGCGTAAYGSGDLKTIQKTIADTGATIAKTGSATPRYAGQTSGTWYEVTGSGEEGSEGPALLVGVLQFESENYRDAAFASKLYSMQRLGKGAVMTWKNCVIVLTRVQDSALFERVFDAFQSIGASGN